jgi:predicted dehydrogenase
MDDGLRINRVDLGVQQVVKPDLNSGGVAFYDGKEEKDSVIEARTWISAITDGTPLVVKPEQALVVSEILEAVYESAKTGKTVEF